MIRISLSAEESTTIGAQYALRRRSIRERLRTFKAVPKEHYFYELCFCLLTPQSKAAHCNVVVQLLDANDFQNREIDPEPFLHPEKSIYVRFHKSKARRLIEMKSIYTRVASLLESDQPDKILREELVRTVKGIGYKEASHFLRNIGKTDVTIIDRHILKNLVRYRILKKYPDAISPKRYLEIETHFEQFAARLGIPHDELDLLFWSNETGFLLK